MKNYLYLSLLAPTFLMAQESPTSLTNQCAQKIANHNLRAQEQQYPGPELLVHTLDFDSQERVELERKKLILLPELESNFKSSVAK